MPDLHTLMTEAAPALAPTTTAVADADVARGRRRLRVHRARRTFGASGLAAAALVGAFVATSSSSSFDPNAVPSAPTALVAYTGAQSQGFLLDEVPDGWNVQHSDLDGVVLAPDGAGNGDGTDWVGKLGVQLSLDVTPDLTGSTLRVKGHPAVVTTSKAGSTTLFVKEKEGYLVVQAWKNLGWDAEQIIEFGQGVTVTDEARGVAG